MQRIKCGEQRLILYMSASRDCLNCELTVSTFARLNVLASLPSKPVFPALGSPKPRSFACRFVDLFLRVAARVILFVACRERPFDALRRRCAAVAPSAARRVASGRFALKSSDTSGSVLVAIAPGICRLCVCVCECECVACECECECVCECECECECVCVCVRACMCVTENRQRERATHTHT